jgi:hypothetical protein
MKSICTKAAVALAAMACTAAVNATVINFENVGTDNLTGPPFVLDQDYVTQSGFRIGAYDPNNFDAGGHQGAPNGSLVGTLLTPSSGNCLDSVCPDGNSSTYLGVANDGVMFLDHSGEKLVLTGFDAAYLGPYTQFQSATSIVAYLGIEADRSNGTYAVGVFAMGGAGADGAASFDSYLAQNAQIIGGSGSLTSGNVVALYAYAYYCDTTTGNCAPGGTNKGQFAIDNISITAVPEPSSWLLMALGLFGVGAGVTARRRRAL